jgi:hypothetical protein
MLALLFLDGCLINTALYERRLDELTDDRRRLRREGG